MWRSIAVAALTLLLVSCSRGPVSTYVDRGEVVDHTYRNKFLGLKIDLNPDWHVASEESLKVVAEMGEKIAGSRNQQVADQIEASKLTSMQLFLVTAHPIGSLALSNASVMAAIESVKHAPGVTSGREYLWHAKRLLTNSRLPMQVGEITGPVAINGQSFYVLHCSIPALFGEVKQELYVTLRDGFAVTFTVSYANEEGKLAIEAMLQSTTFE